MDRTFPVCMSTLLVFCVTCGCGETPRSPPAASPSPSAAVTPNPSTDVISRAASDFLDAVLAGDIQRASARLTPQAMQRIIGSGIQFQPPGEEKATFRTGEVRMPTKTQALVQFMFTYTAADGTAKSEEGCCLMRHVDNEWRVSGLAYGIGSSQSWTLDDFETGRRIPIARQPMGRTEGQLPTPAKGRPSPPRTAQESVPSVR